MTEANASKVQKGSTVQINYTLKVDGNVVDSSEGKKPLEYQHGSGQLIRGVESELEGLSAGDKKTFQVLPENGYGLVDSKAVQDVPKTAFQDSGNLVVGGIVSGQRNGQTFQAKIVEILPESVKLDFNHPLAGKALDFEVSVVSVK